MSSMMPVDQEAEVRDTIAGHARTIPQTEMLERVDGALDLMRRIIDGYKVVPGDEQALLKMESCASPAVAPYTQRVCDVVLERVRAGAVLIFMDVSVLRAMERWMVVQRASIASGKNFFGMEMAVDMPTRPEPMKIDISMVLDRDAQASLEAEEGGGEHISIGLAELGSLNYRKNADGKWESALVGAAKVLDHEV